MLNMMLCILCLFIYIEVAISGKLDGPPVFENYEETNIIAEENVTLQINCTAKSEPTPSVTWFNEAGDKLGVPDSYPPADVEYHFSGEYGWATLIINSTSANYTGSYICKAENAAGLRSRVFQITINNTNDDEMKLWNVKVINVTDVTAAFRMIFTGRSQMFEVRYTEILETNITKTLTFSGEEIVVKNLIPGGKYFFKFTPQVSPHKEFWTNILTVILLPPMPEVIYNTLKDDVLSIEWFRKFDNIKRNTIDKHILSYTSLQMQSGNFFKCSWTDCCNITIEIPSCFPSRYTIAGLHKGTFYEISLKAHTSSGFGVPYLNKIYIK